ncbi:hypothetical protein GCM10017044_28570 [Kordiimonas sediminis]|uniref:Uncharacterized protein n=1 Tax=Kordiimonas sediminis TaxID=1735581 RepID=A0A919E9H0_9PROT|nr:hypothetical protein [Kordiimonas sediminis]GHF31332.1 hypothetical protein GCM10017044_28570 [Kordiimonas sediminis]
MSSIKAICNVPFPLGLEVIEAKRGVGSFLLIDFVVSRSERGATALRAAFLLWVYLSDWEIYQDDKRVLDCDETDDRLYEDVLNGLVGSKLIDIDVDVADQSSQFMFDNNISIRLESDLDAYENDDDLFMFFDRSKDMVHSYSPQKGVYSELSRSLPED